MMKILISITATILTILIAYYCKVNFEANSTSTTETNHQLSPEVLHLTSLVKIQPIEKRISELNQYFTDALEANPFNAMAQIHALSSDADKQLCYDIAINLWDSINSKSLQDWLAEHSADLNIDHSLLILVEKHAGLHSKSINYASYIRDISIRNAKVEHILKEWVLIHPDEAVAWTLSERSSREWLKAAYNRLYLNSIALSIHSLKYLASAGNQQISAVIELLTQHLEAKKLDEETISAIQSLTPYSLREQLITALLPALFEGKKNSIETLNALVISLNVGDSRSKLQQLMAYNWAYINPNEAANFAESLSGEERAKAINAVVNAWLETDLESADRWLQTVDGDIDLAAESLAKGSAHLGNMQIADNWLHNIQNEEQRSQAIFDVFDNWFVNDPKVGVHYLVFQKQLNDQQKLDRLHEMYPNMQFLSPIDALEQINRLPPET